MSNVLSASPEHGNTRKRVRNYEYYIIVTMNAMIYFHIVYTKGDSPCEAVLHPTDVVVPETEAVSIHRRRLREREA